MDITPACKERKREAARITVAVLLTAVIGIVAVIHLLRQIDDPDFFWHLSTGQWIWEHKGLPDQDPFSYTSPTVPSSREHFILTSYWISQVIYYSSYLAGGMGGIIILRFVMVGVFIGIMASQKKGDAILYLGLLLIFVTAVLHMYAVDRPQIFSCIFLAALLHLIQRLKHEPPAALQWNHPAGPHILMPLLMLLWANMHGGHLLGQALIVLHLVVEGIRFVHPALRPMPLRSYRLFALPALAALAVSFINPNTFHAAWEAFSTPSFLTGIVMEYKSSVEAFLLFKNYAILLYWFLLLVSLFVLAFSLRSIDIAEAAFLVGAGYLSFTQGRYIIFFLIAAVPFIGRAFPKGLILQWGRGVIIAVAVTSALFLSWGERANLSNIRAGAWLNTASLPVSAADFIAANDVRGKMYNYNGWGGYLIWRLGPERRVFVDTRNLYAEVCARSLLIDNAFIRGSGALPFWKEMLQKYDVKYIVIPLMNGDRGIFPLLRELIGDEEWRPVFFDFNSLIFVKDAAENYHVLRRFSIPRDFFIEDLIRICDRRIRLNPADIAAYMAKGDLYALSQRLSEAQWAYKRVLDYSPRHAAAQERIRSLPATPD